MKGTVKEIDRENVKKKRKTKNICIRIKLRAKIVAVRCDYTVVCLPGQTLAEYLVFHRLSLPFVFTAPFSRRIVSAGRLLALCLQMIEIRMRIMKMCRINYI